MKEYIYTGNEFPNYKGKKVTIINEIGDMVQVKVVDESTVAEVLGVWGIGFYCKMNELEANKK